MLLNYSVTVNLIIHLQNMLLVTLLTDPNCKEDIYGLPPAQAWSSLFRGPLFIVSEVFVLAIILAKLCPIILAKLLL